MNNLDAWSGKEKNKYILKWLVEDSDEGGRTVIHPDAENRLKMLMDILNSANGKNSAVINHPEKHPEKV